jgi:hypothetical protein
MIPGRLYTPLLEDLMMFTILELRGNDSKTFMKSYKDKPPLLFLRIISKNELDFGDQIYGDQALFLYDNRIWFAEPEDKWYKEFEMDEVLL